MVMSAARLRASVARARWYWSAISALMSSCAAWVCSAVARAAWRAASASLCFCPKMSGSQLALRPRPRMLACFCRRLSRMLPASGFCARRARVSALMGFCRLVSRRYAFAPRPTVGPRSASARRAMARASCRRLRAMAMSGLWARARAMRRSRTGSCHCCHQRLMSSVWAAVGALS